MAVIVPLLETVPIAGVSLLIKVDFDTVNFILFPFSSSRRPKRRVNDFILLVDVVIVGDVEILEKSINR
jgi:hypothetical protein